MIMHHPSRRSSKSNCIAPVELMHAPSAGLRQCEAQRRSELNVQQREDKHADHVGERQPAPVSAECFFIRFIFTVKASSDIITTSRETTRTNTKQTNTPSHRPPRPLAPLKQRPPL